MSFLRFWILLRLRRGQCRLTPLWLFASWLHCDYWHHGSIVIIDTRTPLWLSTSWLHCDYRHLFQISNTELVRLTSIIWVIVKTFPIELCLLSPRFLDGIYKRLIFSMYQLYKKKKKKVFMCKLLFWMIDENIIFVILEIFLFWSLISVGYSHTCFIFSKSPYFPKFMRLAHWLGCKHAVLWCI